MSRGRGRPPKNSIDLDQSIKEENNESDDPNKPKRKYTKRKLTQCNTTEDGTIIKTEAKKRGRKRGRRTKEQDATFKPEEILDYIHRNYPLMGIDRIRDKVIDGLKVMREFSNSPYILYKFTYDDTIHYYDDNGAILSADGKLVGYFVRQPDGMNKMCMFTRKNKDARSFQQVIDSIENTK